MFKINDNYQKLPGSYLFSTIAKKVNAYSAANPEKQIIRLGIGDVTQPIAPAIIEAMHKAVDEMGHAETFHGYAPDLGYDFLRNAIVANDYKAINFDYLLIEHYKDLNINESELAVILVVNHLLKQHNDIITAEDLSFKMNLDSKKIDEILSNLVTKNIVDLVFDKKGAKLSLQPLKNKLFQQFKLDIYKEEERQNENIQEMAQNIYAIFEKELKKTLSPLEVSRIQEWFATNNEEDISNAIKDLKSSGKKVSIRAVDKILLAKAKSNEINQEGVTALNENWNKNLEETIKIAKTKWLDDDDE